MLARFVARESWKRLHTWGPSFVGLSIIPVLPKAVDEPVAYSLRLNHRKVYHRKFDLLSESGSLMWQKSLSNLLDLDSFIAILNNMNLVSDFVR